MTIQKKSLITNRADAKKAIIATHAASTNVSATSVLAAKRAVSKVAFTAKSRPVAKRLAKRLAKKIL
jgi:hypothetical protein